MNFPERKTIKLKNYDYSATGSYFVTICTRDRMKILSEIVKEKIVLNSDVANNVDIPENGEIGKIKVELSEYGRIVERELAQIGVRYRNVSVETYVIMPDHIHAIIRIRNNQEQVNKNVMLHNIVGGFKSIVSRVCYSKHGVEKIFQRSYMEHVIRNKEEYDEIKEYITKNPIRWYLSKK